jgi:hypothetical protein
MSRDAPPADLLIPLDVEPRDARDSEPERARADAVTCQLVGADELLILSIHESSVPEDPEAAFLLWRQRAEAAAGTLAAVLDERVVGTRVFEDAVLLANGETIGAMDWRERVGSRRPHGRRVRVALRRSRVVARFQPAEQARARRAPHGSRSRSRRLAAAHRPAHRPARQHRS